MKNKFKIFKLNSSNKGLFFVSLFVLLISSCLYAYMPSTSAQTIVYVGNETALRNAVDTAVGHTIIALTADIQLTTTPLNIVAGKNIALTSNSPGVFFRLIGASGETTIRNNGTLEIAGITVTHSSGANGIGVTNYGLLILSNGTISGNTALIGGGGVDTWGDFIMNGGSITNNTAEDGGGIAIASIIDSSGMIIRAGTFTMNGGTISDNTATSWGGGVYMSSPYYFTMNGGEISNNIADNNGGGVYHIRGTFTMGNGSRIINNQAQNYGGGVYSANLDTNDVIINGGEISNNTATSGGGMSILSNLTMNGGSITNNTAVNGGGINLSVAVSGDPNVMSGNFTMNGGVISNNTATFGGGVRMVSQGNFTMNSGEISNNTAEDGGGVCQIISTLVGSVGPFILNGGTISNNIAHFGGGIHNDGSVIMYNGTITNNTATDGGGGVHTRGDFNMYGGEISNNTATLYGGGGVYNYYGIFNLFGGAITHNTATDGGGINNEFGNVTMAGGAIYSNTATYGGGIYNTYRGNFTMLAGTISNNAAIDGGGIYFDSTLATGQVKLYNGTISGNTASVDGGGVWVAYENLNRLFVYDGMVFFNNRASAAYDRNPIDDALYYAQIGSNVVWTTPFTQGYNNYDISYTNGARLILYNVTVNDSYASVTGAGSYQAGDPVTINAGTRPGYTFTGWTINEGSITLPNTPTATFTMPPTDVVVTANWQADQTLTGTISVTKLTNPPSASIPFSFITSAPPGTFSLTDGTTWQSGPLTPGNYTLTEIAQAGWDLSNIIINDPTNNSRVDLASRTVFIALDPGETITILYQNTQHSPQMGSINVVKTTCPTDASNVFNFVTSISPGTFSLTDGATWQSGPLTPGNYTLTEIAQSGWDLANIIIIDPTNNSRVDLASRTVFIALDPGETITILYQNTQQTPDMGSFSVTKVSCPVGSFDSFSFVTSAPGGSFSLTDGQSWNSGMLPPGTYTVTELVPPGWEIANILLDDPSGTSTVDLATGTAIINLQAGTHVSIVYQDAQAPPQGGMISVVKATCPTDTTTAFSFVSSASEGSFSLGNGEVWNSGELAPGRYLVTEIMQPGWVITDIVVVDPSGTSTSDLSTGTAFINLQAGTHVTILYQNTEQTHPDCCNQCNKNPCQCNPCSDCHQKPCVCKPCSDCHQKPCVCKPCSDCHQKPCVCKPCNDCQALHRYEVFDISLTWHEAQAFCEKLGGHLATITSQQESEYVYSLLKNHNKNWYYIGGTDEKKTRPLAVGNG